VWIVVYNGFARFAQLRCCCTPLVRVAYSRPTDWDKTTVLLVAEAPTCMAAWSSIHCWWPPAMKSHELAGSSNASNTHASLYRYIAASLLWWSAKYAHVSTEICVALTDASQQTGLCLAVESLTIQAWLGVVPTKHDAIHKYILQ